MEKWMVYQDVHRLKKLGFSNSRIARNSQIFRNRVIDYLGMTPDQFAEFISSLQNRTKKLDPYQENILMWLKEHVQTARKTENNPQDISFFTPQLLLP